MGLGNTLGITLKADRWLPFTIITLSLTSRRFSVCIHGSEENHPQANSVPTQVLSSSYSPDIFCDKTEEEGTERFNVCRIQQCPFPHYGFFDGGCSLEQNIIHWAVFCTKVKTGPVSLTKLTPHTNDHDANVLRKKKKIWQKGLFLKAQPVRNNDSLNDWLII